MDFNRRGAEAKQENKIYTMKKIVIAISILMMSISCGEIFAQKDGFSLHLSGVFPNGKFGEFDEVNNDGEKRIGALFNEQSKTGAAGTGFGLGFKYQFSIPQIENLRFLIGAEVMWNPLNSDAKDYIDEIIETQKAKNQTADYMDINTTFPNYLNIPLMAGLNYSFGLTDKVKLYGEFGIGLNIRIATKFMLENEERGSIYDGYYYYDYAGRSEVTFKYDNATSFAYQLGVGVLFDKVSIGLHWYNLGSVKVKGEVTSWDWSESESFTFKELSTSMLTLKVGFHF
mgnify:CR=1 FL=1